jgi:hypothetical protein
MSKHFIITATDITTQLSVNNGSNCLYTTTAAPANKHNKGQLSLVVANYVKA